jgi:hypothetical protein
VRFRLLRIEGWPWAGVVSALCFDGQTARNHRFKAQAKCRAKREEPKAGKQRDSRAS